MPFVLTGSIPNPVDAMFETVSGFTTTGASILPAVEDLPKGILFWRSFTHWIGGMGVLVFLLSLLPLTGGSHVNLMKAESPGPQVDKLVPKVQSTAKILYGIYFGLTVIEFVFLLFGGMPVFEALLTSFGTAGTGGFGIKNDASVRFTQRDGCPLGLGFQFISERNGTVKAGVVPGVAGAGAALVHQHNQGILVTVNQDLLHFLHVAAGCALMPDFLAAAGVVNGFPQFHGHAQGFRIHIGQHQRFMGNMIHGEGRDQAILVKFGGEFHAFFHIHLAAVGKDNPG